jgi:hypothetical protein
MVIQVLEKCMFQRHCDPSKPWYIPDDGMSHPKKYEYSAAVLWESQNLHRKCGGFTVALSGMMVIANYIKIIQLVKK